MKKRNAQLIGQIFILIIASVVFVLILLYGYNAISSLMQKGEQVALIEFQNELTTSVSAMALDYGSVKCKEIVLPKKYSKFCFVGSRVNTDPTVTVFGTDIRDYPLIRDSVKAGASQNVFLIPPSELSITLEKAVAKEYPYFFCINATRNRIALMLEGIGTGTEMSPWPGNRC